MRFILRHRFGFFQRKSERIFVPGCQTTDDLLDFLQRKTARPHHELVLRFRSDRLSCRVVRGWPLLHYEIKQGDELQLEVLEQQHAQQHADHSNSRYLMNVIGQLQPTSKQELGRIAEEDHEDDQERDKTSQKKEFNLRAYLDSELERLLKYAQKGQLKSLMRLLEDLPAGISEQLTLEVQRSKLKLLNEVGEGGWSAVHYAVYCGRRDVLEELLQRNVELNRCTVDGWLPLQLAVHRHNAQLLKMILEDESININEVTTRGTALHIAARLDYEEGIGLLVEAGADWRITDERGRNCLEVCTKEQTAKLICKKEEQRLKQEENRNQFSSLAILRGGLFRTKTVFLQLKQKYFVLDPYQGSLIIYETPDQYPKRPKETIPVEYIKLDSIVMLVDDKRSWHMKKDHHYFEFYCPQKRILAAHNQQIAVRWVEGLKDAVRYQQHLARLGRTNEIVPEEDQIIIDCDDSCNKLISNKEVITKVTSTVCHQRLTKSISSNSSSRHFKLSNASGSSDGGSPMMPNKLNLLSVSSRRSDSSREYDVTACSSKMNSNEELGSGQISIEIQENRSPSKHNFEGASKELASELNSITTDKTTFSSFEIIKTLGSGAFGKVFLARHLLTGKEYALKALKKKTLILQKQIKYAVTEARVLKQANHPFIINLHYAFQTPNYLYLALDYCPGKDLSFHLASEVTFSEQDTKFYIAELLLALEHLHSKSILYRDMKPENILLDSEGHIKLADFGLSKDNVTDKTKSFCGSPAYLAPEILNQKGGTKETDLYGVGMVMYECLTGESAFYSDDITVLYHNINTGTIHFPKHVSENAKSIISGLMERDVKKRLGARGYDEIKNHPFFKGLDWKLAEKRGLKPPHRQFDENAEDSDDEIAMFTNGRFTDVDYSETGVKSNRLNGFSFVRVQ